MVSAMRRSLGTILAVAGIGAMLATAPALLSQPIRDKVLSGVEITEDPACAVVTITFNLPIRYLMHFPHETGSELRVRLEPISVGLRDRDSLSRDEAALPPPNQFAALSQVFYRTDPSTGPYLTLRFRRTVTFTVTPGSDSRSLQIAVLGPEPSGPCPP